MNTTHDCICNRLFFNFVITMLRNLNMHIAHEDVNLKKKWTLTSTMLLKLGKHLGKKKNVCLRSPDRPFFSAADPNLFLSAINRP